MLCIQNVFKTFDGCVVSMYPCEIYFSPDDQKLLNDATC
jgi:hypothetical protein